MRTWREVQAGGLLTLRGAKLDSSLLIWAPQGSVFSLRHCRDGQYRLLPGTPGCGLGYLLIVTMVLHLGFDPV